MNRRSAWEGTVSRRICAFFGKGFKATVNERYLSFGRSSKVQRVRTTEDGVSHGNLGRAG